LSWRDRGQDCLTGMPWLGVLFAVIELGLSWSGISVASFVTVGLALVEGTYIRNHGRGYLDQSVRPKP
jgi:hypothetical protein